MGTFRGIGSRKSSIMWIPLVIQIVETVVSC